MIDTITLRLEHPEFRISNHDKFHTSTRDLFYPPYRRMGSRGYADSYQNPTKSELKRGIYKPQLTVRKRIRKGTYPIYLYIQFSVPKLLYGNNFDEVEAEDISKITSDLSSILETMGVIVLPSILSEADVVKVHYSKNVVLPEFVIPAIVIGEIKKVDITTRLDLSEKDYRNSGHSVRYRTNDSEFIVYDKKKDLQQARVSEKKSIEKDNAIQLNLFDVLEEKRRFEVIRFEARFNTQQRIQKELNLKRGDVKLEKIFSSELSCRILSRKWQEILKSYNLLQVHADNLEAFLVAAATANPGTRLSTLLAAYAFINGCTKSGSRRIKRIIQNMFSNSTWYSFKKNLESLQLDSKVPDYMGHITQSLKVYQPLRLAEYPSLVDK